MPQINILNILQGDNQSTIVDKINYNYDQILSAGGGPQGQQGLIGPTGSVGPQGPQGVQGVQGPSGTKWFVQDSAPAISNITGSNPWTFPTLGDYWLDPDSANQEVYVLSATGWVDTGYGLNAGELFQKVTPIDVAGGATGSGILISGAGNSGATATTLVLSDATISDYTPGGSAIYNVNYEGAKLKIATRNDRLKILSFGRADIDITTGAGATGYLKNPSLEWASSSPVAPNFYDISLINPGGAIGIISSATAASGGVNILAKGEITATSSEDNIMLRTPIPNKGTFISAATNGGFLELSNQSSGIPSNNNNAPLFANATGLGIGLGTGQFRQSGDDSRRLAVFGNTSISKTYALHISPLFIGTSSTPNYNKGVLLVEGHSMFGYPNPTGDSLGGIQTTGMAEAQGKFPQLFVTSPSYGPGVQVRTKGSSTYAPRTIIGDGVFDFTSAGGAAAALAGTGPDITQEFYAHSTHTFGAGPLISYQHKISTPTNTTGFAPVFSVTTHTNSGVYGVNTVNKTSIQTKNSNRLLEIMANGTGGGNKINLGAGTYPLLSVNNGSGATAGGVSIGSPSNNYSTILLPLTGSTFTGGNVNNHSLLVTGVQTIGTDNPISLFNRGITFNNANVGGNSLLKISRDLYSSTYNPPKGTSTNATGFSVNNYPNGLEITSDIPLIPLIATSKGGAFANKSVAIAVGARTEIYNSSIVGGPIAASTGFFVSNSGENIAVGQSIDYTAAIGVSGADADYAIKAKGNVSVTGKLYGSDGTAALPTFSFINANNHGMYLPGVKQIAFGIEGYESLKIWRNDPYATELVFSNANNIAAGQNGSLINWGDRLSIDGWTNGLEITDGILSITSTIAWTGPGSPRRWFNENTAMLSNTSGPWTPDNPRSIYAAGDIHTMGLFVAGSDLRIKNILEISDPEESLDIIKKIQVTKYSYKDILTKGNGVHTKVIAQQIKEVLPEAVNESSEFIPNIYQVCKILNKDNDVYFIKIEENSDDLKNSEIIKIVDKDNKSIEVEVKDYTEGIISFHSVKNSFEVGDEIFVYGKKVSDFLSVDYDNIMCVNVSATQELSKIIDLQKEKIDHLEEKLSKMEDILSRLIDDKI